MTITLKSTNPFSEERETLMRAQVYSEILSELRELWWWELPQYVRETLKLELPMRHADLPHVFARWWLQWEEASPIQFALPPSMRHFGPVSMKSRARFIFDSMGQESDLSKAIARAWEIIPDPSRELMLFCWAGLNGIRDVRNDITHWHPPDIEKSSAKAILAQDFHGTFDNLHGVACYMADYLFLDEESNS